MVVKYRFRLYLLTLVLLVGFGALAYRLWNLSVERHEEFVNKVPGTKTKRARIPGVRGEIKDRNGHTLVSNKPSFEMRINLKTLVDEYRKQLEETNKRLPKEQHLSMPLHKYLVSERRITREKEEIDIVTIVNEVIIENLNKLGLAEVYNANQLRVHYRTHRGVVPWVYRSGLTFEEFSQLAEHHLGLPGVEVTVRPVRQYIYDSLASHVLGYVNSADEDKVSEEEKRLWDFFVPDDYGIAGIEKYFDHELRGRPGVKTYLQDARGKLVRELREEYQEPRQGNDIYLTLDARIQFIAERALRESTPAIGRGAVVVLDPNNGQVIAMASVPSYNPNKFIPKISVEDYNEYLSNKAIPLLNRSVRTFAPGSTYKIMTAFAGILAGNQNDRLNCSGGINYGNNYMKCWIASKGGSHGTLGLADALKTSCNCYFYQYGNRAGLANIEKAGNMFGLGQKTGIELEEESPGILPTASWIKSNQPGVRANSPGLIANTSIGQGFVLASPLQLAGIASAVGNGGIAYRPHLLRKIMDGEELIREQEVDVRGDFKEFGLTPAKLDQVRKGMWKVVMEAGGTAKGARIPGIEVAGKTGTAQNWTPEGKVDNHTLFITFAPYDAPKFAVCVLVQGGKSGGGCAAPIAKRIMEQAIALDNGYTVELTAVPEVTGNFNHIEAVSYAGVQEVSLPGDVEDNTSVADSPPPRTRRREDHGAPKPKPKIKVAADAEGASAIRNQKQPPAKRKNFLKRVLNRDTER